MLSPQAYDSREPDAQVVAQALDALYKMDESDPLFDDVYEYWQNAYEGAKRSNHSRARNAEEYVELESSYQKKPVSNRRTYAEIKESVDITQYAEQFGPLKQSGGKFKGKCFLPGHDDKTASLWIYPDTKSFYCFGCRKGGDTIDLIKLMGEDPSAY